MSVVGHGSDFDRESEKPKDIRCVNGKTFHDSDVVRCNRAKCGCESNTGILIEIMIIFID